MSGNAVPLVDPRTITWEFFPWWPKPSRVEVMLVPTDDPLNWGHVSLIRQQKPVTESRHWCDE